jgi:hypothetical protein
MFVEHKTPFAGSLEVVQKEERENASESNQQSVLSNRFSMH